jgi:hypothetical protein
MEKVEREFVFVFYMFYMFFGKCDGDASDCHVYLALTSREFVRIFYSNF